MQRKKASIVTNSIILLIGICFLIGLWSFPDQGAVRLYESAVYYPLLLIVLLMIFAGLSLYRDIFGADRKDQEIIDFSRIRNYVMVIATACAIAFVWQMFDQFYIAAVLGTGVLLFWLNPEPSGIKKGLFSAGIAAGFTVFIYLVFDLLLQVKL